MKQRDAELIEYYITPSSSRRLFSLYVDNLTELSEGIALPPPYFSCLLICDATNASDDLLLKTAYMLLAAGLVYQCAWGHDCARVETMFDIAHVQRHLKDGVEYELYTTSHKHETLDKALWFLLNCAWPAESDLSSTLVITVGNPEWDRQVQDRLANRKKLDED